MSESVSTVTIIADDQTVNTSGDISTGANSVVSINYINYMVNKTVGGGWNFSLILYLIIIIVGIVGNMCMLVLLIRERLKKTSLSMYIIAMTTNDILSLLVFFALHWLLNFNGTYVSDYNRFLCKISSALDLTLAVTGSWLLVALVIERLVYLYFPRMNKLFSRRYTGICVIIMIVCFSLLLNGHYILWLDLEYDHYQMRIACIAVSSEYSKYTYMYIDYHYLILGGILPSFLVIFGNVFFLKALRRAVTTPVNNVAKQIHGKNRDILVYTMMTSVLFMFLDLPQYVMVSFNLPFENLEMITIAIWLLYRTLKVFAYILYKRNFRIRCIKQ